MDNVFDLLKFKSTLKPADEKVIASNTWADRKESIIELRESFFDNHLTTNEEE